MLSQQVTVMVVTALIFLLEAAGTAEYFIA
jgi:hypothetical protein